jgi:hypothetical protein
VIVGTANGQARVKMYSLGNGFNQIGSTISPFGSVGTGVQLAAVDTDGDGSSEVAMGILDAGSVRVKVYDGGGVQQASYIAATGIRSFALGQIDVNRDGLDDLQVAVIPSVPGSAGNQVRIVNPLTGSFIDGFDAFATLTGGVSIDGN